MNIKFKNVDQGDSILLTWNLNNRTGVGIIDCNIANDRSNPLLDELKSNHSIEIIDFILLSHPHYDHFSGLEEILDYCEKKNIKIFRFLHTCSSVPEYIEASVRTLADAASLSSLFKKMDRLYGVLIDSVACVNADSGIYEFDENWRLEFLAPSYGEQRSFNRLISTRGAQPYQSNLLSTIVKIYQKGNHILLTSDAEYGTFKRIVIKDYNKLFSKSNLILGQISHHGAKLNFHSTFWRNQIKDKLCPAAISVGKNSYGHPSDEVIYNLEHLDYKVDLTNDFVELSAKSFDLDLVSTKSGDSKSQDLIYSF